LSASSQAIWAWVAGGWQLVAQGPS
jgi:hypothetical protein